MRLCVRAVRSRTLRLCALLLGLAAAVSLTLTDLFSSSRYRHWPQGTPATALPPLRFARPPGLEVMDSWAAERRVEAPLDSLLEEQLLSVQSSAGDKHSTPKKQRSYKILLPLERKEPRGSAQNLQEEQSLEQSARRERAPEHHGPSEHRAPGCLDGQYSETLPSASVVICFRDEPLSSLLQTVHSVLDTAPAQHLKELLLLDDDSQDEELKGALSQRVSRLKGVRLIHTARRLGPGRCRSLGASRASGDVLVMMGPRCKCHAGWLEPLLERLAQDRARVVSPVLDVMDPQSQQYSASPWPLRGVWDWSLDFHWDRPHAPAGQTEDTDILPLTSPALGGEVLAVDRLFFDRLGAYDPGAVEWGPQQVELSLRVWLCGGSLEVVPCSRVALLGGPSPMYDPPDPKQLQRDRVRVAESWMGPYKSQFYQRNTLAHFIRQAGAPNLTERVQLQRALGCRDLSWYLSSVSPELYVPQDRPGLSGELYNVGSGSCMDYPRGEAPVQARDVVMVPCSGTGAQHCELNSAGELRWGPRADLCLGALTDHVLLSQCSSERAPPGSQHWSYRKMTGQLLHSASQLCLQAEEAPGKADVAAGTRGPSGAQSGVGGVALRPCSHLPTQQWSFEQLVEPEES